MKRWRGTIVHRIELADDGALSRVKIVDSSLLNWLARSVAARNTIILDGFPSNKNFIPAAVGNEL